MKKIFLIAVILLFSGVRCYSQQVYNLDKKNSEPKTEKSLIGKSKETKDKAIYKEKEYVVYMSEKGKLFIIVMSKNGNLYRKYINREEDKE
nr:MAG TPA: hypothetical protein [Caudoviricetes sp.]